MTHERGKEKEKIKREIIRTFRNRSKDFSLLPKEKLALFLQDFNEIIGVLFRMSEGDENNSSPPRPGLVQYLQRDPVTSIMFGLRIYTFFAGCMAILNPYR